jgi:hypothetical protein
MRKLVPVLLSVIAFLGMTIPAANAAVSRHSTVSNAAGPSVTCSGTYYFQDANDGGFSYNNPNSGPVSNELFFGDYPTVTQYCREGSAGDYQFFQYGTDRCLFANTQYQVITESAKYCSSNNPYGDFNLIADGAYVLLQIDGNSACVYSTGYDLAASWMGCNKNKLSEEMAV